MKHMELQAFPQTAPRLPSSDGKTESISLITETECRVISITFESEHMTGTSPRGRSRRAFTLIELLIVVVIIGILAAIAIPKFANTKGKANAAALKTDLRNLSTAEEAYFFENSAYTSTIADLQLNKTAGVTLTIVDATSSGWSASATHPASFPFTCALFNGNVTALSPATVEGLIGCQ